MHNAAMKPPRQKGWAECGNLADDLGNHEEMYLCETTKRARPECELVSLSNASSEEGHQHGLQRLDVSLRLGECRAALGER
jgi:hypothetical protein